MERFPLRLLCLTLLVLAACTAGQEPRPTPVPLAQNTDTPLPTPSVSATLFNTPTPTATATAPPTPTATFPPRPTSTLEPTATPPPPSATPPPGPPFTEGMIAILWNPERDQTRRIVTYQLDFAIPGPSPDEWVIQTALTGLISPYMFPSPDGRKLALTQAKDTNEDGYIPSPRGGDFHDIYLYTLGDNSLVRLTDNQLYHQPEVSWLPGSQAFTYPLYKDIILVNLDDSASPQVMVSLPELVFQHAWSPDGRWLAVFSAISDEPMSGSENARFDLFNRETGELVSIASGIGHGDLLWSPDSRWLAFTRDTRSGLFVVDLATFKTTELVTLDHSGTIAAWSPDGQWLAFVRERSSLHLWNASTGIFMELMQRNDLSILDWPPQSGFRAINWSADSSELLLTVFEEKQARLVVVSKEDGSTRELFTVDRIDFHSREESAQYIQELRVATWSVDGQWLFFYAEPHGIAGLYVVSGQGGNSYLVLETGIYFFTSRNIAWLPQNPSQP